MLRTHHPVFQGECAFFKLLTEKKDPLGTRMERRQRKEEQKGRTNNKQKFRATFQNIQLHPVFIFAAIPHGANSKFFTLLEVALLSTE